ncbi:MAG: glycoside hydrolase family 5 protein [Myxococcales bacterium]
MKIDPLFGWQSLAPLVALATVSLAACASSPAGMEGTGGATVGTGGIGTGGVMGTGGAAATCPIPCVVNGHPIAPGGYYVDGNKVYDDKGQVHVFKGVARPSLEWSVAGERLNAADYALMKQWGSNVVRLALNQDFWLKGAAQTNLLYPTTVDKQIQWAKAAGLDVILDLHWSDRGNLAMAPPANNGNSQQDMADLNSLQFWKEIADRYKEDGRITFELYNEPKDISWSVWKNGGQVNGFMAVGMQQLYDAIRATGADNLVIIGGVHWGYDLSGVPANKITGYNIMYATHPYDTGDKQMGDWERAFGFLTSTDPVIMTEFGSLSASCPTSYTQQVVTYIKSKGLSFTGWAWYVGGCAFPSLITDWNGTASAAGAIVKQALAN